MSFGKMPIANGFIEKKDFDNEFFFNMEVGFAEDISLFQLKDHPTPEQMFNDKYPFFTGSSEYMKIHFIKYAEFIKNNYLKNNSKIIEIGSNDGTFLKNFKNSNLECIGFEPSSNVADIANKNGIKTLNCFFNLNSIDQIKKFKNETDVIYAANVICHVPNLPNLIESVDKLLSKDGVFIFEEPYLGAMYQKTSYDQIYDEHIFMFSGSAIQKVFNLFDMELIDLIKQLNYIILLISLVVFIVASKGLSILYLFLLADLLCCSAVLTIFYSFYTKSINEKNAYISIILGLAIGLLFFPSPDFSKSILIGILLPVDFFPDFISQSLLFLSFLLATFVPIITWKIK